MNVKIIKIRAKRDKIKKRQKLHATNEKQQNKTNNTNTYTHTNALTSAFNHFYRQTGPI